MDVAVFSLVLLALTAFVAAPLYRATPKGRRDVGSAAARHTRTLEDALGDLELDRASGLLEQASYEEERAALQDQIAAARDRLPGD